MDDNNKKDSKIVKFPDGSYGDLSHSDSDEDLENFQISDTQSDINPKQIVPQFGLSMNEDPNKDKSLSQVVGELVDSEVKRMSGNLLFLNELENSLKLEIKSRIDSGTIDMDTLFDAMDAFGKSIDRSDRIIKQKNSPLVNILIDNRKQVQNNEVNINSEEEDSEVLPNSLDGRSRKKLTSLISALLSTVDKNNEIVVNDFTEVPNNENSE